MSSDTDSPCQTSALRSSILWTLGIHLLLLPLFARLLDSRRNTRRGTEKAQMNIDLVTDNRNNWMIAIGKEGTKSYATYTFDFSRAKVTITENMAVEMDDDYPNPPDDKRYHLCTIDADQRDRLRDAILQSNPGTSSCSAVAILQVWNMVYQQGHLNMENFTAGVQTLQGCFMEIIKARRQNRA